MKMLGTRQKDRRGGRELAASEVDAFLGVTARRRPPAWALILAGLALLVVLVVVARTYSPQPPVSYSFTKAVRGDLTVTVAATGNLQPTNEVEVGSELSGLIGQVFVDTNDRVARGQPLARLDTSRLSDALVQAQAGLAAAQAQEAKARASLTQAAAMLARYEQVYRTSRGNVPSRVDLDARRADNQRAAADVAAARAEVAQERAQLSSARTNLAKATIYSPIDGVVLSRDVEPGQTVAASFQAPVLFRIAQDLRRMKLQVSIDEADVGQVRAGQEASFTVDAFPGRQFSARIARVDVGANRAGSARASAGSGSNVVAYAALLEVSNDDLTLRPGMTATATIIASERRSVLLVPSAAFEFAAEQAAARARRDSALPGMLAPRRRNPAERRAPSVGRGGRQLVYVLGPDGRPNERDVVVGDHDGSFNEIVSGNLAAGDRVITGTLTGDDKEPAAGGAASPASPPASSGRG